MSAAGSAQSDMTTRRRPRAAGVSDRLPALGTRGGGWVAIQMGLLAAAVVAGVAGAAWPAGATPWLAAAGGVAVLAGVVLLARRRRRPRAATHALPEAGGRRRAAADRRLRARASSDVRRRPAGHAGVGAAVLAAGPRAACRRGRVPRRQATPRGDVAGRRVRGLRRTTAARCDGSSSPSSGSRPGADAGAERDVPEEHRAHDAAGVAAPPAAAPVAHRGVHEEERQHAGGHPVGDGRGRRPAAGRRGRRAAR